MTTAKRRTHVKELSDDPVDLSDKRFWRALKDQQLLDALDLRGRLIPLIGPIRPLRLPLGLIDELVDDLGRAEVHTYVEASSGSTRGLRNRPRERGRGSGMTFSEPRTRRMCN